MASPPSWKFFLKHCALEGAQNDEAGQGFQKTPWWLETLQTTDLLRLREGHRISSTQVHFTEKLSLCPLPQNEISPWFGVRGSPLRSSALPHSPLAWNSPPCFCQMGFCLLPEHASTTSGSNFCSHQPISPTLAWSDLTFFWLVPTGLRIHLMINYILLWCPDNNSIVWSCYRNPLLLKFHMFIPYPSN